ncbi:MAG: efflux RND transporter periplasmic adaptor subunit [Hyphomicrobium sp.]|jgi:HlyD family secretion protein
MLKKVNPTAITLGIAGLLAVAVGIYVNSVSWGPAGEQKNTQATAADGTKSDGNSKDPVMNTTWAASATGRVEPKNGEVRVSADIPGRIVDIPIAVNDRVLAGDLLVRLDDDDALTKVVAANAEAQVRVRERNEEDARGLQLERRNAEDAVANAERAVFGSQQEFDDALDEKRKKNGPEASVDAARSKLEEARKSLADKKATLASVNAKSGMPLPTRLESALTIARAELNGAELGVEHTRVRALNDATVLNIVAKEGEIATPSPENALVVTGDVSAMKVRAEVEERDAAKIHVGQRVVVRADAYPDQDFEGRVSTIAQSLSQPNIISRGPRRPNDVEVLEAVIDLDGLPPLLTGMRVDVFFKHDATASTK